MRRREVTWNARDSGTYSFFGGIDTRSDLELLRKGVVLGCIDFIFGEDIKTQLDVEFLDADLSCGHGGWENNDTLIDLMSRSGVEFSGW